ncbi:DUF397 domain-containing protein [Embleya sp. NPDC055664]|uniref:DUF397 domain-containing protein n=1 Tax=Embleya sp. MST-111070 TaxID=3398231 RepID=UPI003F738144
MITPTAPPSVWRTSSYSGNQGQCVASALLTEGVGVLDSKDPSIGHIAVNPASWSAMLKAIRAPR